MKDLIPVATLPGPAGLSAEALNHLIATSILGWKVHQFGYMRPNGKLITHQSGYIPRFSETWAGMEAVISAIEAQGYSWWLEGGTKWPKTATVGEWKATEATAPEAMAVAALRAYGVIETGLPVPQASAPKGSNP